MAGDKSKQEKKKKMYSVHISDIAARLRRLVGCAKKNQRAYLRAVFPRLKWVLRPERVDYVSCNLLNKTFSITIIYISIFLIFQLVAIPDENITAKIRLDIWT